MTPGKIINEIIKNLDKFQLEPDYLPTEDKLIVSFDCLSVKLIDVTVEYIVHYNVHEDYHRAETREQPEEAHYNYEPTHINNLAVYYAGKLMEGQEPYLEILENRIASKIIDK